MRDAGGTGQILCDLGVLERWEEDIEGAIGGAGQPSTLLILFQARTPFLLALRKQVIQPFTDRFLAVGLRGPDDTVIPLDEYGAPLVTGRLPPGSYAISVATSQWQQAPFRLRMTLVAQMSLACRLTGSAQLAAGMPITRLQGVLGGRGVLRMRPSRILGLRVALHGSSGIQAGLVSIPTYVVVPAAGLPHAWLVDNDTELALGCGNGRTWITLSQPVIEDYVDSALGLSDFRGGSQRLVFSARAPQVYATYLDLGRSSADVTTPVCPDAPNVTFQSAVNGSYRRSCTFSLPINGATQLVILLREELRWNNDILRDADLSNPAAPRYTAVNARSVSTHQRMLRGFVVTATAVRQLRQLPSAFLSRIDEILPPLDGTLVIQRLTVPGEQYPRAAVDCLLPEFALTGGIPSEADQIFQLDPYGNLLLSFGMSWSMQARQGFASAAIYDFLRDYASILAELDYDRRSYSFVNRVLASRPTGLRQYSPYFTDGGYAINGTPQGAYDSVQAARLRYGRWRGDFPATADTMLSLSGERWTLTNFDQELSDSRLRRGTSLKLLVSYDWERPDLCRTRLGELGFSSADLLDRDTAWRSLMVLNPGRSRALAGEGSLAASRVISLRVVRLNGVLDGTGGFGIARIRRGAGDALVGRGRLSAQLRIVVDGPFAGLYGALGGSGRLTGGTLLSKPLVRISGQGGLGRPVLSLRSPGDLTGALTGQGSLGGPALSSVPATAFLYGVLAGGGSLSGSQLREPPDDRYFSDMSVQAFGWEEMIFIDWWGN